MFDKLRLFAAGSRLADELLYEEVVKELGAGIRRQGLWAKAFADAEGNEAKAQALYIRYRVQSLRDENELGRAAAEQMMQPAVAAEHLLAQQMREKGYRVEQSGTTWRVREPLGAKLKFKSDTEFREYALRSGMQLP